MGGCRKRISKRSKKSGDAVKHHLCVELKGFSVPLFGPFFRIFLWGYGGLVGAVGGRVAGLFFSPVKSPPEPAKRSDAGERRTWKDPEVLGGSGILGPFGHDVREVPLLPPSGVLFTFCGGEGRTRGDSEVLGGSGIPGSFGHDVREVAMLPPSGVLFMGV